MSFLGGSSGSGQTTYTNQGTQQQFYTPYLDATSATLANINGGPGAGNQGGLQNAPFQPYDISKMFAPLNNIQNQAFSDVGNLPNQWMGQAGSANTALAGVDPSSITSAGAGAFANSGAQPGALQTAQPYANTGSQLWTNPGVAQSYLNPYVNNTVNAANQLQSSNFTNNVMPGLTNAFVGSGGGLGSSQYGNAVNMGLTNLNQNIGNTSQGALSSAYNNAYNMFNSDATRNATLAGTMGNLSLGQQNASTNLGTAQAGAASAAANAGIAKGNAFTNLANSNNQNSMLDANALLQVGNQIQQNAQNPLTAAYQQFEQGIQWPYQTNSWAANVMNQSQYPVGTTSSGVSQTTGAQQQQGSMLGQLLGGASTIGSLFTPGASGTSAGGNIFSGLFGSSGGQQYGPPSPAKRGGYFKDIVDRASGGGYLRDMNRFSYPPTSSVWDTYFAGAEDAEHRKFKRGGYLGMDRPSQPPMPTQWDTYAKFAEGGDVLHGILGAAGSLLGNLIPIPIVGPTVGKFLGHAGADLIGGKTGDLGSDAAHDFAAPLPFIGGALGDAVGGKRDPGPGDAIEGAVGHFSSPLGGMLGGGGDLGGGSGMTFKKGGYFGMGTIPHMPRENVPGDPYFSSRARGGFMRHYADGGNVAPMISPWQPDLGIQAGGAHRKAEDPSLGAVPQMQMPAPQQGGGQSGGGGGIGDMIGMAAKFAPMLMGLAEGGYLSLDHASYPPMPSVWDTYFAGAEKAERRKFAAGGDVLGDILGTSGADLIGNLIPVPTVGAPAYTSDDPEFDPRVLDKTGNIKYGPKGPVMYPGDVNGYFGTPHPTLPEYDNYMPPSKRVVPVRQYKKGGVTPLAFAAGGMAPVINQLAANNKREVGMFRKMQRNKKPAGVTKPNPFSGK